MKYFWNTRREAESEKITILKAVPLLAQLNQRDLKAIASSARLIEYRKGQTVYNMGDPPHAFFVIATGRITLDRSIIDDQKDTSRILHGGEFFGELSLLTGKAHSATAVAKNDALLLEIEKGDFERLTRQISALGLYFSRFLGARLRGATSGGETPRESKLVAIYSALAGMGKTTLSINLAAALAREETSKILILDISGNVEGAARLLGVPSKQGAINVSESTIIHPEKTVESIFRHPSGFSVARVVTDRQQKISPRVIAPLFSTLARQFDYIVIDLAHGFDEGVREALHQADTILFVTGPQREMLLKTADICKKLKKMITGQKDKCKIVLNPLDQRDALELWQKEEILGDKIALILPSTPITKSYTESTGQPYLVASPRAEYSRVVRRIARQIRDSMVGLALGSGAALGLAHIGVLKVLEREDIPIDIIAGSSIGALIGALWTSGKTVDDIETMARDMARWRILKLVDPYFPHRGMIRGDRLLRFMRKQLKSKSFLDTIIPLKITAVDLYTHQQVILDEGSLSEAVRASVSIPGVFTPARRGSSYLTDGGLLSPCPVHVLTRAHVKKVIAVNVLPSPEDMVKQQTILMEIEQREKEQAFAADFWARVKWYAKAMLKKALNPSIVEVIMNSMQTMEYELAERSCEEADVVLRPILHGIHVLNFNEAERFIARGEEETLKHLDEIKQMVKQ